MINCPHFEKPHFEKKGSCRFHETTGTCWYGHGVSVEASPPVNLVVGLPYPPFPGSALPADVGVPPPLSSAIGVDFGAQTEPWFSARSDVEIQTTPALSSDFGTETEPWLSVHSSTQTVPLPTSDSGIQTTPAPPKVDCEIQTEHQELIDVIRQEYAVLLERGSFLKYFPSEEHVAVANEIFDVHLPRLDSLKQWLLVGDRYAREHGWQPLRIFDEPFVQFVDELPDPPFDQIVDR